MTISNEIQPVSENVFRFETFGNEGFWTDAVRLPAGIVAARVTPLKALQLGLQVDVDALDDATKRAVAAELKKDPTGSSSALFYDPAVTVKLINANANAVAGMVVKDSNGDGKLDVVEVVANVSRAVCRFPIRA